jgi:hypothetical protein
MLGEEIMMMVDIISCSGLAQGPGKSSGRTPPQLAACPEGAGEAKEAPPANGSGRSDDDFYQIRETARRAYCSLGKKERLATSDSFLGPSTRFLEMYLPTRLN